jgi:hypothetical protein
VRSPEALARAPPELVAEAVAGRGALDRPLADAIARKVRAMREQAAPRRRGRRAVTAFASAAGHRWGAGAGAGARGG